MVTGRGAGRGSEGIVREFGIYMYALLYLRWITNKDLLYSTGNFAKKCYVAAWMGGEFGGEWIHVYVWLSRFAVHLKPSFPVFTDLFQQVNIFSYWFPGLMRLPLEFQSCWVGGCHWVCSWSTVGVLITKGSGGCGFHLVFGWMGLPPIACLVGWHLDEFPFQGPQLGTQSVGLLPGGRGS